jgi:hypothetical protein
VDRVQVFDGGFDSADVFLPKWTASVEVKGGQWRTVENNTDTSNDNEFQPAVLEPGQRAWSFCAMRWAALVNLVQKIKDLLVLRQPLLRG